MNLLKLTTARTKKTKAVDKDKRLVNLIDMKLTLDWLKENHHLFHNSLTDIVIKEVADAFCDCDDSFVKHLSIRLLILADHASIENSKSLLKLIQPVIKKHFYMDWNLIETLTNHCDIWYANNDITVKKLPVGNRILAEADNGEIKIFLTTEEIEKELAKQDKSN